MNDNTDLTSVNEKFERLIPAERFSGANARAFDLCDRAYEMEADGQDIIHLSVGDPDFDTPRVITESAIKALGDSRTHYSPIPGEYALRQAIADHSTALYDQAISPNQVIVFSGAQNALFATMSCVAGPGDEVLILEPAYTTYDAAVAAGGAKPKRVALSASDGFQIDVPKIADAISDQTRAILINSPSNPSGAVFDASRLDDLVKLCRQKGIWIISDEVYAAYVFDGVHASPISQAGGADITFAINSLSKSHAMTGWRLGWVVAPAAVSHQLIDLAQCMQFGVSQFIQDAAATALTADIPDLELFHQSFRERRDSLCAGLRDIPGIEVHKPAGGMFLLVDVAGLDMDGYDFSEKLLMTEGISVVPGFGFGDSLKHFVRIGYLADNQVLADAVIRIARFVASIESG